MENQDIAAEIGAIRAGLQALQVRLSARGYAEEMPRPLTAAQARYMRLFDARKPKWGSKRTVFNPEWTPSHSRFERWRFVEYPADSLRYVGTASEIARAEGCRYPDARGYYVDSSRDKTTVAEVWRLPARDGEYFVIGVSDPNDDNHSIMDFHSAYADKMEAARAADHMASAYAEDCREDDAKQAAEQRREEIAQAITEAYAETRDLCREIRANCDKLTGLDRVRKLIRAEVRRVRQTVRKLRAEDRKLEDNFWFAVEGR